MTILDSTIMIDGKEYVLFYTQSDFDYPDLETALSVCLKSDLDKIKKEYSDMDINIYEYIYPVRPFLDSYEDLKESIDGYFHVGDVCSFCDDCFKLSHNNEEYKNHKKEKYDYYVPIDLKCPQHKLHPNDLFCVDEKGN